MQQGIQKQLIMATKVIALIRVSTQKQDFEAQKEAVIREIIHDGYKEEQIKVVEGKESAIKNDEEHRETLNEMKRIIADNPTVESVYVFAIDRLARKVSIVLSIKDYLLKRNINLTFLNPRKMSTMMMKDGKLVKDDVSEMLLMFLGYGAEMEMQIKQARWKEAKDKMKKEGKVIGGKPQLGYYKKKDKTIGKDPEKAQLIKDLFNDYITRDIGLKTLYREYRDKGLLPPTKSEAARLQAIFRDETYSGKRFGYPLIVDAETQQKVKDKMSVAKSLPRNETRNVYLSKGILRDFNDVALEGAGAKGCYRTRTEGKVNTININCVDSITWDVAIKLKALQLAHQQISMEEEYKAQLQQERDKLQRLERDITVIKQKQEKALTKLLDGKVTDDIYNKVNGKLTEEIVDLTKQLIKTQSTVDSLQRAIKTQGSTLSIREDNISEITDDAVRIQIIKETIKTIRIDMSDSKTRLLYIEPLHRYRTSTPLPHHYVTRIGKAYKTEIYEAWQHPDDTFAEIPFTGKFLHRYKMDKNKTYHYIKEDQSL